MESYNLLELEEFLKVDYYNLIIGEIEDVDKHEEENKKMDQLLLNIWSNLIEFSVNNSVFQYMSGQRSNYKLTDQEFKDIYKIAAMQYVNHVVSGLNNKGLLNLTVNSEGEMIYELKNKKL